MKFIKKTFFCFIFIIINCQKIKQPLFKCEHNNYEDSNPLPYRKIKQDETYKRRIEGESNFEDFNIYLDFANLEKDMAKYGLSTKKSFFESSMKKAVNTLVALLKVKPLDVGNDNTGYNLKDEDFEEIGISYWNKDKFGNQAISNQKTFQSQNIHLAIFGSFADLPESTLAQANAKVHQPSNGQPLVGLVKINKNIDYSKKNSDIYFQTILVHEFTHILGFSKHFFETYYHNFVSETDQNGIERFYLNSARLLEVAKKYFSCDTIQKVELENQGGEGTAGSHWEARILLGEYMNGYAYTEEQVISEFTLALLEDSGYYEVNYFTGGLMRFGKGKGCQFLQDKCVISYKINENFENEFFDTLSDGKSIESSCSSGRQSRTYNAFYTISDIPQIYQYFENPNIGGFEPADYCPVPHKYENEESNTHFVGHCSTKGSGDYGSMIFYSNSFNSLSKNVKSYTGETLSDHSFCYLSSLSKNDLISTVVRANCYETFCSDQSLTVKIFDDYIVCPKEGGKILVDGYNGYFLCPDYNLICSGSYICNNMFDCVEKQSALKEETYTYDYTIQTSQNIEKANLADANDQDNYELSENGKCPQYCKHCQKNNICLKCLDGYGKKLEKDSSIKCHDLQELEDGYYINDKNVYIKCIDNCSVCENTNSCSKCATGYIYYQKKCIELPEGMQIIDHCLQYNKKGLCEKCEYEYGFNQNKRDECLKIDEEFQNHYSKDNISYFPCSSHNINCSKCYYNKNEYRVKCTLCINNLILLDRGSGQCLNEDEILSNSKYYLINETNAGVCAKAISNCISCNSANSCEECKNSYEYDNTLNKCVNKGIQKKKAESQSNEKNKKSESEFISIKKILQKLYILYLLY